MENKVYISKSALKSKGIKYFVNLLNDDTLDTYINSGRKSIDGLRIVIEYDDIYLTKSKKDSVFDTLRGWYYYLGTQY